MLSLHSDATLAISNTLQLCLWCSAALSLMLYSCNIHCHLPDTLLHLHWAPTHFWTFWHMSVPLVQEEKEENLQNRGGLIKRKRCTEQIARQTSALGCPTSLQSSKWPYIQSRSIWSGFHCAKSDENKAINFFPMIDAISPFRFAQEIEIQFMHFQQRKQFLV